MIRRPAALAASLLLTTSVPAQSTAAVTAALDDAVGFFAEEVATHGGYVYRYSADLTLREAEGIPGPDTIWIQPPGTPAVGEAFLDAWRTTGSDVAREAVERTALALIRTQLHSGGWHYSARFDAEGREAFAYRRGAEDTITASPVPAAERTGAGGWPVWKRRRFGPANQTILDDDVTQSALRLLIRVDAAFGGDDPLRRDAIDHGLAAILGTQYPCGAWSSNWDRFPRLGSPSAEDFPVRTASCPSDWSRKWTKDFRGCYVTNDHLHANTIELLRLAWHTYGDERYRDAVLSAGEFLLRAQMPDPQPAWAQAYDAAMQPVWDRAFEPPAVSGHESQRLCGALLDLHADFDDPRYLDGVERALAYLERSRFDDGTLPRFRAPGSDRPIYFRRGPAGRGHVLTFERAGLADNYAFVVPSRVAALRKALGARRRGEDHAPAPQPPDSAVVRRILAAQDERGAWAEAGVVRDAQGRKTRPEQGVILSARFARNVHRLCAWIRAQQ